jgi:hypothetical protein
METTLNQTKREAALIRAKDLIFKLDELKTRYREAGRIAMAPQFHHVRHRKEARVRRLWAMYEGLVEHYNAAIMDALIVIKYL